MSMLLHTVLLMLSDSCCAEISVKTTSASLMCNPLLLDDVYEGVYMKNDNGEYRYMLLLNEEQARMVSRACEFYCRLHIGQLDEVRHELLLKETKEQMCERSQEAETLLYRLKQLFFPSLHGHGHSYGVGHDRLSDRAWNVYTALRYRIAWHNHPEGGIGVNFDPPMQLSDEPIPDCRVVSVDQNGKIIKEIGIKDDTR